MRHRLGRWADRRRGLDARLWMNDRPRFIQRLRVNVPARFDERRRNQMPPRQDVHLGTYAAVFPRAGEIGSANGVAQELDQLQVQRRDDQGNVGLQSHASSKANGVASAPASARRA